MVPRRAYCVCQRKCTHNCIPNTRNVHRLLQAGQYVLFCTQASSDRTLRVWDIRGREGPMITVTAHESDVNVATWNRCAGQSTHNCACSHASTILCTQGTSRTFLLLVPTTDPSKYGISDGSQSTCPHRCLCPRASPTLRAERNHWPFSRITQDRLQPSNGQAMMSLCSLWLALTTR
jgi:WD40 repeat protein